MFVMIYCCRFSGLDIQPQNVKPVLDVLVLFWGGELTGLQMNDFHC